MTGTPRSTAIPWSASVTDRLKILRVIGFSLQDHSARNNGVGFVLACKFAYDDRDLERTGTRWVETVASGASAASSCVA